MPEGDSLRRAERLLRPILDGQVATRLWFKKLRGYRPHEGQRIERVDAVGKYLLVEFDRNLTLRTHLGMTGVWRAYQPQQRVPRDPRLCVVITTALGHAACSAAPLVDTFIRESVSSPLHRIGPDLSDDEVDLDAVVSRTRAQGRGRVIADVLLDQQIAAGVGNVFKSEVLHLARINPFTSVDDLDDATLRTLWQVAHRQLVTNRDLAVRSTTGPSSRDRTHVYGRARLGCHRCGNAIDFAPARTRSERSTYWCPSCQPER